MLEHAPPERGARPPASPPSSSSSSPPPGVGLATEPAEPRAARRAAQGQRERYVRQGWRSRDRAVAELERTHSRLRALAAKLELGAIPRAIPRDVRKLAAMVLADGTGFAGRSHLRRLGNRVYAGAVVRAAFVPLPGGGFRYGWADARARHVVALGIVLHHLSAPTRRQGMWGGGLVRAITEGALRMLLANPFDPRRRPSSSAMNGTHRPGATYLDGQVGYLKALKQAGALYAQQLPTNQVQPDERWPSLDREGNRVEHSSNRYWLVTDRADAPQRADRRAGLHELRALAQGVFEGVVRPLRALVRAGAELGAQGPPPEPQPP
jgi:hypothetical protein